MSTSEVSEKKYRGWIIAVSIAVPVVVAFLFQSAKVEGFDTTFLPPVYATINGLTAIGLLAGLWAILNKHVLLHRRIMTTCIALSALFLVLYVVYHSTSPRTEYGGEGLIRSVYFFILLTHIALSVAIIPLVLVTYVRALAQRFDRHKKLARITFPIWLYVAVTGVVVYFMISPYYA